MNNILVGNASCSDKALASRMHRVSESSRGVGGGLQLQNLFFVKVEHAIKPQHIYYTCVSVS